MFTIIIDSHKAINAAKIKKSVKKSMSILLYASLIIGVSSLIFAKSTAFTMPILKLALGIVSGTFILTLFMAYLVGISLNILTKKGGFYESLTALSYSLFILSGGVFIVSLLNLLSGINTVLTIIILIISGLVLLVSLIKAKAIKLRTAMDLFGTDLITIIMGFVIVYIALFFILYIIGIQTMLGTIGSFDPSAFQNYSGGVPAVL